ncbi:hypothetical protein K2X85_00620 [bacterium]|nr:hypothetical protein [bacterium]
MTPGSTEQWSYTFLMSSLPPMPPRFDVARLPISAAALEERLSRLAEQDLRLVEQMRDLLFWDRMDLAATDEEVLGRWKTFLNTARNGVAREIVSLRMDVRTIVAALRSRRRGLPLPASFSPWMPTIRRNLGEPSLGLGTRFPWIATLDRYLAEGNVDDADRLLLGNIYEQWSRLAAGRPASLEAVLLYVARWDVIHRFVSRDRQRGEQRMELLVTEAIGDYRRLF